MIVAIRTKVMTFTPQKKCPMMIKSLSVAYCNIALWVKANGKVPIGILELCLSFYSHPNI